MHVTHEDGVIAAKTPEELAGLEVRRLRRERGWTQEELARQMAAYGYDWHQSTVARTETADRPLRLNEVVHLAALFRVPVTQFLLPVDMTLGEIDAEIAATTKRRDELEAEVRRVQGFVDASASQLEKVSRNLDHWQQQLELVQRHLYVLDGLRDILRRGQEEVGG